jgi:hypothetical protein
MTVTVALRERVRPGKYQQRVRGIGVGCITESLLHRPRNFTMHISIITSDNACAWSLSGTNKGIYTRNVIS